MADFRKLVYVLALVALFTGLTVSANAQGLFCDSLTATPQIVRAEGYTELVGDISLRCRAVVDGVSTPAGQNVPQANVHVAILGTTVTSRTVASSGSFLEALLMIDEPSPTSGACVATPGGNSSCPQLYCGKNGNDIGPSGAGVCGILSDGNPADTYNGTVSSATYGSGNPNIFQGRPDGPNGVVFPFVPFDPPGTSQVRTIRITNIRIDATKFDPSAFPQITAVVTVEGQASVTLQFNNTIVATVLTGMGATTVTADKGFLQCIKEPGGHDQVESIKVQEGFRSSWKPKNAAQYVGNYFGNPSDVQTWLNSINQFRYDGSSLNYPVDVSQAIPAIHYFTESGFENISFGTEHGVKSSGVADYGTRISVAFGAPPSTTTLQIPIVVFLSNGTNNNTGVMVMTTVTSPGKGAYAPVASASSCPGFGVNSPCFTIPAAGATVVYEVLFADPGSIESATIPAILSYGAPVSDAAVGTVTQVGAATFAPYYTSVGTDADGIPRFKQTNGPSQDFVGIGKCSCSLLFPWVVSDSNYVTGIQVANTSMDPTNTNNTAIAINGYSATQQSGKVTVYYFGQAGTNPSVSGTASQTASPPSATVPAGGFATFIAPSGFAGYAVANSQFQYCHGTAFLFSVNPGIPPMSYLGLVMDGKVSTKTWIYGNGAVPLQRTIQVFKDSLGN